MSTGLCLGRIEEIQYQPSGNRGIMPASGANIETIEDAYYSSHRRDWTSQGVTDSRRMPVAEIHTVWQHRFPMAEAAVSTKPPTRDLGAVYQVVLDSPLSPRLLSHIG